MNFQNSSLQKLWKDALVFSLDGTHGRYGDAICYEQLNVCITLTRPFKDITEPLRSLAIRHNWIYPDLHELKSIVLEKHSSPHYKYSYANRLFAYQDIYDQIGSYVLPLLAKDPLSRRACVSLIDPAKDAFSENSFFPGLSLIQFQVRNGSLVLSAFIRSCDAFLGLPANLFQLKCIGDLVAAKLDLGFEQISIFTPNLHVYEHMLPEISLYVKRT